jgi:hypothetical protein
VTGAWNDGIGANAIGASSGSGSNLFFGLSTYKAKD